VRLLLLGDIVGKAGCRAVHFALPSLRRRLGVDLVVANAENAVEGTGLDPSTYADLRSCGVDVVTSGNHIWQRREILPLLDSEERLLRPDNYPAGVPGHGWVIVEGPLAAVGVLNLEGRKSLSPLSCPFVAGRKLIGRIRSRTPVVIVDFHAEATDEKEALALHLDGLATAVIGTHTHVQTADERVLPGGTGYLTDAGMCGSSAGVIGMNPELSVRRFVTQMPLKMEVHDGPGVLCGALLEIDASSGRCLGVSRVRE
jgi:2',3'-cyclic-nucleotide 2'-phosphodiesterase